ncbi:hypothetical protein NDU88_003005 [Pleurodeles waltl]|uniref:Uncharacterized protein n=1 Tax=Pleurodeles waltl TaxID=8319 RepID=A0AAV7Q8R4_PLEWA|nr:hypothetical protein NDU88_003005 [Pleurodeles waltl]
MADRSRGPGERPWPAHVAARANRPCPVAGLPLSRSLVGPLLCQLLGGVRSSRPRSLPRLYSSRPSQGHTISAVPAAPRAAGFHVWLHPQALYLCVPTAAADSLWVPICTRARDGPTGTCLLLSVPRGSSTIAHARGARPRRRPQPPHRPVTSPGRKAAGRAPNSARGASLCPQGVGPSPPECARAVQLPEKAHAAILATPL